MHRMKYFNTYVFEYSKNAQDIVDDGPRPWIYVFRNRLDTDEWFIARSSDSIVFSDGSEIVCP